MSLVARRLNLPGRLAATDLELAPGQLVCLIGPNGSGKSSLLQALAGIGRPGGSVTIAGDDPWTAPPARRQRLLTYLPASRDIAWPLLASDLIRLGGSLSDEEIGRVLDALELRAWQDRRTDRLSTGERSRVLIARALAPRPKLLLLDEPVSNLDPLWQLRLLDLVRAEVRANHQAALVAIHDLDLAGRFADRLIVMQGGRIVADGLVEPILAGPVISEIFGIRREAGRWQPIDHRPASLVPSEVEGRT